MDMLANFIWPQEDKVPAPRPTEKRPPINRFVGPGFHPRYCGWTIQMSRVNPNDIDPVPRKPYWEILNASLAFSNEDLYLQAVGLRAKYVREGETLPGVLNGLKTIQRAAVHRLLHEQNHILQLSNQPLEWRLAGIEPRMHRGKSPETHANLSVMVILKTEWRLPVPNPPPVNRHDPPLPVQFGPQYTSYYAASPAPPPPPSPPNLHVSQRPSSPSPPTSQPSSSTTLPPSPQPESQRAQQEASGSPPRPPPRSIPHPATPSVVNHISENEDSWIEEWDEEWNDVRVHRGQRTTPIIVPNSYPESSTPLIIHTTSDQPPEPIYMYMGREHPPPPPAFVHMNQGMPPAIPGPPFVNMRRDPPMPPPPYAHPLRDQERRRMESRYLGRVPERAGQVPGRPAAMQNQAGRQNQETEITAEEQNTVIRGLLSEWDDVMGCMPQVRTRQATSLFLLQFLACTCIDISQ
jgi:hypothetical protein